MPDAVVTAAKQNGANPAKAGVIHELIDEVNLGDTGIRPGDESYIRPAVTDPGTDGTGPVA
jgi:hypothetical protein